MDRFHRITVEASEYDDVVSIEKKVLDGEHQDKKYRVSRKDLQIWQIVQ
jgi:hypothetical protein